MLELDTSKEIVEQIAKRVEHERVLSEYTQAELAKRAGIPSGTYRNFIATQRISLENLISLFKVLRLYPELRMMVEKSKPQTMDDLKKQEQKVKKRVVKRKIDE
jgi:predicted transcriptional regulator